MSVFILLLLSFLIQWIPLPNTIRAIASVFILILMVICGIIEIKNYKRKKGR